jgi:tripartite-type tricarboxylate transporter receptor subunit TctC
LRVLRYRAPVGAPKNTSAVIIEKLNKEINAGLANPVIKARLGDLGLSVLSGSPADFGKLIADETEKWGHQGGIAFTPEASVTSGRTT